MNRILATSIAAVLTLTLAACGSDDSSDTSTSTGSGAATATETTPSTATTAPADSDATAAGTTPITITAGDETIRATLNDTDAAQDFLKSLPATLPASRNLGIEYIAELPAPFTETGPFYTTVEAGDLVYYNPEDTVTIIYAPTSSVPTLTKLGEITSDLDVFEGLPDDVDLRITAD